MQRVIAATSSMCNLLLCGLQDIKYTCNRFNWLQQI